MYNPNDALAIYRGNHFNALILEYFAKKRGKGINPDEFPSLFTPLIHKELLFKSYSRDIQDALYYLICIGLIEIKDDKLLYLSREGIEVLQKCTFQQLAATTYFNFRSMKYSRTVLPITIFSLIIALSALILNFIKI